MEVRMLAAAAMLLIVVGCAKNPDSIAAITMPVNAYAGLSCEQLTTEFQRSGAALQTRSQEQRDAVAGDAVGVFLIGVPMSSLTGGDKEGLVAQHKGELLAIQAAQRQQGCAVSEAAVAASPAPQSSAATTSNR